MHVRDHGGCLQEGVSHVVVGAPSALDRKGDSVNVDDTVTAGTGWNCDCFAHVADRCHCPFEHMPLLTVVEVIEPVGVTDEFGNENVGEEHGVEVGGLAGRRQLETGSVSFRLRF